MKKHMDDVYLVEILVICSLVQADFRIFGMDVKTMLTLVFTLVFLAVRLVGDRGFVSMKMEKTDVLVYAAGAFSLAGGLYRLIVRPEEYGEYMTVLSLCVLYFAVRNCFRGISADAVFLASISNAAVCVLLLFHCIVDAEFLMPVSALAHSRAVLSWLVLVISINVTGFCIYENRGVWYGANSVVGFFLLLAQNNAAATGIVGFLFLALARRYVPRKRLVRRMMQMFFAYAFLLCNMPLVTGYTKILQTGVSYDLELGVYLELALAVSALWFFHVWEKSTDENDGEDAVLPQIRSLMEKMSVIPGIALAVTVTAAVRGRTDILPDVLGKVTAWCRESTGQQEGILETAATWHGTAGVIWTACFLCSVFDALGNYRHARSSRHKKLFHTVSWMFTVQALFLTQSMASMPVYAVFLAVMLNERGGTAVEPDERKGGGADETDYTDTMLQ